MKISEFYNRDYVNYSSYDNLRKIGSVIDGQKNTARKIVNTILDKNIKSDMKVSQLNSFMAEHTEYLHGDASGVIVTLAQDFAGTNNIPLLMREGNFGTRFNKEASAPRYIYTYGSREMFNMFNKDDETILEKQFFEGSQIEPKFYLPSLPLILINGSEGISSGFAQKILPRNPKDIEKYLRYNLEGKNIQNKPLKNKPFFNGFNGKIEQGDEKTKWIIKGSIVRKSLTKVEITEIPIGYTLKGYLKVLNTLEEEGVFSRYDDFSDNNKFSFIITFHSKDLKVMSDDDILEKLKLVKKISENYTVIDKDNRIKVFDNINDMFWYYYDVKIEYMIARKKYIINKITRSIKTDVSRYLFIKAIVNDELQINKRKKDDISKDIDKIDNIIKKDGDYSYLLSMPIYSLTKEKMDALMQSIKDKKKELTDIKKNTPEDMWLRDLS